MPLPLAVSLSNQPRRQQGRNDPKRAVQQNAQRAGETTGESGVSRASSETKRKSAASVPSAHRPSATDKRTQNDAMRDRSVGGVQRDAVNEAVRGRHAAVQAQAANACGVW